MLSIVKLNAPPTPDGEGKYPANTLFFVADGIFMQQYMSNSTGTAIKRLPLPSDINTGLPVFSDTPPDLPCAEKLWFNTAELTLYVQYDDGTVVDWVEALASIPIPEFAGTGSALTMARSDHNHDSTYLSIGTAEW